MSKEKIYINFINLFKKVTSNVYGTYKQVYITYMYLHIHVYLHVCKCISHWSIKQAFT